MRLNGEQLSGLPEHHLAEVRRRCFGIAFQRFNLILGLSALGNVMLPAYPLGLPHRTFVMIVGTIFWWPSPAKAGVYVPHAPRGAWPRRRRT